MGLRDLASQCKTQTQSKATLFFILFLAEPPAAREYSIPKRHTLELSALLDTGVSPRKHIERERAHRFMELKDKLSKTNT